MNDSILNKYTIIFEDREIHENVKYYFEKYDRLDIYTHTIEVVQEVEELAQRERINFDSCVMSAYLHDLGQVVKREDIVQLCEEQGHAFESGEKEVPSILHQTASRIIANQIFGIEDEEILNAVACHTTLKANPSEIEKVLFICDKLSWKATDHVELIKTLKSKAAMSKEEAIKYYLSDLNNKRHEMKCYHKWAQEAFRYFCTS